MRGPCVCSLGLASRPRALAGRTRALGGELGLRAEWTPNFTVNANYAYLDLSGALDPMTEPPLKRLKATMSSRVAGQRRGPSRGLARTSTYRICYADLVEQASSCPLACIVPRDTGRKHVQHAGGAPLPPHTASPLSLLSKFQDWYTTHLELCNREVLAQVFCDLLQPPPPAPCTSSEAR